MKFSIVTPSYNQGHFIETTLKSVLNQTHDDVEYIVVDGGSTDNTNDIVSQYSGRLKKYISEPDKGQTDAINKGFTYADGDVLAYLNSDDYYFEDTLEKVNEVFSAHPEIDVVYGDCVFTDANGQFMRYFSEIWEYYPKKLLNNSNFIMQPSTFWRRDVFEKYGPFDPDLHFGFDWALWCEFTRNQCRFYRLHEVLSANRVYEQTKTSSGGNDRLAELRSINKKYKTTLLDNAYYTFSFSEYAKKPAKTVMEHLMQAFYFVMSYQNILFHIAHAQEKIINGVCPHATCLKRRTRLKVPFQEPYSKVRLVLSTHGFTGQSVEVDINGSGRRRYRFDRDTLDINVNAETLAGDIDIMLDFEHEYRQPLSLLQRAKTFYQSRSISAELILFTVE